jgi:hypothetical protein
MNCAERGVEKVHTSFLNMQYKYIRFENYNDHYLAYYEQYIR